MNLKQWLMVTPLYDWLGKRSYAQSGEDIIAWGEMSGIARNTPTGFYVDVGAYHPKLFSNTYLFYKKGWKGICIDPNPEMEKLFKWVRPRDRFLNVGVGEVKELKTAESKIAWVEVGEGDGSRVKPGMIDNAGGEVLEYWMFDDGAANTFSEEQAKKNQEEAGRKLREKMAVPVRSLKSILDTYLPKGREIDLLSVDVEGMDLEVLKSNDWKKYRPKMIIAEDLEFDFDQLTKSEVIKFLDDIGYTLKAVTPYSLIFKEK